MKFDGLEAYTRNEEAETGKGVELRFPNDIVIIVHRAGGSNKQYERSKGRFSKPHLRQIQAGTASEADLEDMLMKVYADSVVIGWRGVLSGGEAVEFSKSNVLDMFRSFPDLFWAVKESCEDAANFRETELASEAEQLGNG